MRRGEIRWVDLDPSRGAESDKRRPVVIVSNDGANMTATRLGRGVVTVVPVTSNTERVYPFQVLITAGETGLTRDSKAQAEQVRSIAVERLGGRIGALSGVQLAELDEARDNRGASAGLMVMATSHASRGFPRFARHGQNVLVCWDPDDSRSDAWLEAGLLLGLYLVSRAVVDDRGDVEALADVESRIGTELDRVAKLEKLNDKIRDGSEGIEAELRKAKKQLTALLDKAKATLRALNVTLVDESLERAAPLSLARLSDSSERLQ